VFVTPTLSESAAGGLAIAQWRRVSFRTSTVKSLGELVDLLTPREPDPVTGRHRDSGVYRGGANAGDPLLTSLDRLGGAKPHSKADLEEYILRNFIRYSRPFIKAEPINDWEHLVSAQHHGAPTRLLDWTYSPLIAAFFATRPRKPESDRAIWRLDWQMVHNRFDIPPVSLLPTDLGGIIEKGEHFSPWELFDRQRKIRPFAALVEAPAVDARLVAQGAAFTLCSDTAVSFDQFLRANGLEKSLARFVIESSDVGRFRDQLDLLGIDERRIFPDLDGVAAALSRYYG
jgi:hypothetical protein